jgi:hypothetical protein
MVSFEEIQAAYYMVAATGVMIAALWYTWNYQNMNRSRRIQMFMQIYQQITSESHMKSWIDVINMEWKDYEDFERKYGSDNNPENFAKRYSLSYMYSGIGYLLKERQIDIDTAYQLGSPVFVWYWKKLEPIMGEHTRRYGGHQWENLEYLANEVIKYSQRMGRPITVPNTFGKYILDKLESTP